MRSRISDETRLKRGLGQGEGENYKPYLRPRHVPSRGCTTRIMGIKIKREHVFLSNLELDVFFELEHNDSILDLNEQIPLLPLNSTQQIAVDLNIDHPRNEKGKDVVMTTDFFVTQKRDGRRIQTALDVKPSSMLTSRVIEKYQLVSEYWKQRSVRWLLITEKQLDPIKLNNIKFIREHYINENSLQASIVLEEFKQRRTDKSLTAREFNKSVARKLNIQFGDCCRIFYHLLATKKIWFDVTRNLSLNSPLVDFKMYPDASRS